MNTLTLFVNQIPTRGNVVSVEVFLFFAVVVVVVWVVIFFVVVWLVERNSERKNGLQ